MKSKALLILLHGTAMTGAQWAPYAALLSDVADVQAPDLPGHGTRAAQAFSMAAAVATVEPLIAAAGRQPVVLAGHSLGGYAAMAVAERHPDALAGLVLIGSAVEPGGRGSGLYRAMARGYDWLGPERMARTTRRWLRRMADARVWPALDAGGFYYSAVTPAWTAVIASSRLAQLRAVRCPVLVLGGAWDQLHLHARRCAAAAPHGRVVTAPRRHHLWPMTHPDEVAAALRAFIGQLPEPAGTEPSTH
ncbi:alpha/beta fold hydrolase [Ottowia testudinis]|uniref:Alpha/beta hydrolase n=1 Tax=Ottowia testudinis TaxID=2816950 RepID=A0A975CIB0_9BURK|nr:alpha/beta hydrolase [Ottowia testudinis]QTD46705.1 alpha/beta hydrolase [Ottowia testudinis]